MACSCFDCRWLTWTTPSTISRWRIAKSSSPTGLGPSLSTSEDSIYTQSWREYSAWKTRKTGALVMQADFVVSCDAAACIASIKLSSNYYYNRRSLKIPSLIPFGCLEVTSNPLDQSWQMIPQWIEGSSSLIITGFHLDPIHLSGSNEGKQKGLFGPSLLRLWKFSITFGAIWHKIDQLTKVVIFCTAKLQS